MEPIVAICGLIAAGWAIAKTGQAIMVLRARRRRADGGQDSSGAMGIGGFGGGSTSGDSGHGHCGDSHGGGDCGGHGGGHGGS
jgi:hypothetical protein